MRKQVAIPILLALLIVFPLLAGCAGGSGQPDTGTASVTQADSPSSDVQAQSSGDVTAEVSTELSALGLLGERDFGKDKIVFYSRSYNGEWSSDLLYDTINGEILQDAIAIRNDRLQSQYNVVFEEKKSGEQSFATTAKKEITAGDPDFDVLYVSIRDAASLATDGCLIELGSVPHLSLDESRWSPFLTKQMTIAGKKYYATGEITTIDDISIRAVFFNKTMLGSIEGGLDLYDMVDSGSWTLEEMFRLVNKAYVDVGEDGKIELGLDSIGLLAEGTLGYQLLMGTGEKIVGKDADDLPYISITESRPIDVVDFL
ncbi:MAG: hypothetical protein J6V01_02870, partial [Clostridia bacterium]|nr:hypothetical protein [Clostridia bacterium]